MNDQTNRNVKAALDAAKTTLADEQAEEWSDESPTEEGVYWLYGRISYGNKGIDYMDHRPPIKYEMNLVEVHCISNGLLGKSNGQIVFMHKFNREKRQEGWVGFWQPAVLPVPPENAPKDF